jgi:hypothetical protein
MFKRVGAVALACLLTVEVAAQSVATSGEQQQQPQTRARAKELLTDAAIVALLIAASVSAYKAMGKPCACPSDTMRNGRACGGNSAWSRAGGYKPLCFPTDVTAAMISAYRATKAIPGLR